MRKILFVLPTLDYSGAAKQIALLAEGLPRAQFQVRVAALASAGPAADRLESAGVPVERLAHFRRFDLAALWRLRRLARDFRPDVIHTWGRTPLRAVAL